jgi:hypothetical protein
VQIVSEAAVAFLRDQAKAGAFIDATGTGKNVVGPEHHAAVAGSTGGVEAGFDQHAADALPARRALDMEHPQLRLLVASPHQKYGPQALSRALGNPAELLARDKIAQECGADFAHQRLIFLVPAIFVRLEPGLTLDDPANIADFMRTQAKRRRGRILIAEHTGRPAQCFAKFENVAIADI